jgi:hypothetical protein
MMILLKDNGSAMLKKRFPQAQRKEVANVRNLGLVERQGHVQKNWNMAGVRLKHLDLRSIDL